MVFESGQNGFRQNSVMKSISNLLKKIQESSQNNINISKCAAGHEGLQTTNLT